jgi:hypothetical protein
MDENREKQAMAEELGRFGNHPTPEMLSAYDAGELSEEQFDAVQRHLAGCSLCTEALLDLHRFLDLPPEDRPREGVADLETETEWRALRAKLDEQRLLPRRVARRPSRGIVRAVAAVLLLVVGFSSYVLSRSPENFKTLEPLDNHRGAPGEVETVRLPVTLRLKSPARTPFPEYRGTLRNGSGLPLREFSNLKETPSFDVEIPLEKDGLDPGDYRIELRGVTKGTPSLIGTYAFKITDR